VTLSELGDPQPAPADRRSRVYGLAVSPSPPWWSYRRIAANGRVEVACRETEEHLYWLTPAELDSWTVCAHCVGWITHWPSP